MRKIFEISLSILTAPLCLILAVVLLPAMILSARATTDALLADEYY
jgi:hypothetical protein